MKSLTAHNDEVKTKLHKKDLEITTLKKELVSLTKKNVKTVYTKFDKSSVLGVPPSLSHRKPRATRQLSAFNVNRPKFSKSRCAPQVGTKQELSKPVTSQCHHKGVPSHENLLSKDGEMNVGIPNRGRIPSHKNKHLIRLSSPSIRQPSSGLGRSDYMLSKTCLKWVPTGRIFKLMGLNWIPMRSTKNSNVNCVISTVRDSNNTNSYQYKQNLHVGAGSSVLCAGSPTENLKVWRPKSSLSTVTGTQVNRQC